MSYAFWAWIIVAVVCALGECIAGNLLTLPWAIGALAAAVVEALRPGSGWEWIAFLGVSSVLLVAGQRFIIQRRK